jgi:hypothetical protein
MTSPPEESARLDVPDESFRLTAQERASVEPGFDVDALERLLASLHPLLRAEVLSEFQVGRFPPDVIGGGLIKFEDPVLQALLDEVWAPRWDVLPDDLVDHPDLRRFPGWEIAKARRSARNKG